MNYAIIKLGRFDHVSLKNILEGEPSFWVNFDLLQNSAPPVFVKNSVEVVVGRGSPSRLGNKQYSCTTVEFPFGDDVLKRNTYSDFVRTSSDIFVPAHFLIAREDLLKVVERIKKGLSPSFTDEKSVLSCLDRKY